MLLKGRNAKNIGVRNTLSDTKIPKDDRHPPPRFTWECPPSPCPLGQGEGEAVQGLLKASEHNYDQTKILAKPKVLAG